MFTYKGVVNVIKQSVPNVWTVDSFASNVFVLHFTGWSRERLDETLTNRSTPEATESIRTEMNKSPTTDHTVQ